MKRKIIIFDLDGVLFDSVAIATESLSYQYPGLTEEMQKELLTGNFHEELLKISLPKREETEEEKLARQIKYAKNKSEVPMYESMKEFLFNLHTEGYILALNTSALDRNCLPLLERAEITTFFDFLGTAEVSKSKIEKFNMVRQKYDANVEDILFITDTLGDIREADIADIPTVAVTWGAHDRSYFNREPHKNLIGIADSVMELRVFIEG